MDGFRFDLASILSRDQNGAPMENPPILQGLACDPILAKAKLIAEAWDAGGLYQVGSFPSWNRWAEWNGRYRDDMRRFLKGDGGMAGTAITRITGSRLSLIHIFCGCTDLVCKGVYNRSRQIQQVHKRSKREVYRVLLPVSENQVS